MHLLLQSLVIKDQSLVLFDENYAGLLEPLLKYRDKYLMNYKGQKRPRGQRRLKLLYIGKKLLQATSFDLFEGAGTPMGPEEKILTTSSRDH